MRTHLFTVLVLLATSAVQASPRAGLPRFTEEREAAAKHFIQKHLPELTPLLSELKKSNPTGYQQEICEIFQVTEMLADLVDEPKRHDLELKVWKAENRSHILVARMRSATDDEKKKMQDQLKEVARELVDLDIQVLEIQADQLDKELNQLREELSRSRDEKEQSIKTRYERLLDRTRKPKK